MEIKKILLTTDFSDEARRAYPAAAALATRFGASTSLVHVTESVAHFYLSAEGFGGHVPGDDFVTDLQEHLRKETERPVFEGVDVTPSLVTDNNLVDGLRGFVDAHEIDLAVLSSHGRSGFPYILMGSSAERVVRGLSVPVLTYRPPGEPDRVFEPNTILVPFDFSENAAAVLPVVRSFASSYGARFVFFFVIEPIYPFFGEATGQASYDFIQETVKGTPRAIEKRFEELRRRELEDVDAVLEFTEGSPTAEILDKAKALPADLVLMATHGWSGFRHFLLGSIAETVVRKAHCSVLTVRVRVRSRAASPGNGE